MRNLFNFLIKYNYWFLFILLEVASFALLVRFNQYQKGVFFTSANVVTGKIYKMSSNLTSYFHLKTANEELLDRNTLLEQEIIKLEWALREYSSDSMSIASIKEAPNTELDIFKAHVIRNSLNMPDNYITLDKGSNDGIQPEMGVVSGTGVVGIVYMVSPHYSTVISLLNSKSSISCKIQGSGYFGYLEWEGSNSRFSYLKDLPRHAEFSLGDTVITSGYTSVFPEGIIIGTVDDIKDSNDGLSYLLRVKLATDFGKLNNVRVISRSGKQEQSDLEKKSNK